MQYVLHFRVTPTTDVTRDRSTEDTPAVLICTSYGSTPHFVNENEHRLADSPKLLFLASDSVEAPSHYNSDAHQNLFEKTEGKNRNIES